MPRPAAALAALTLLTGSLLAVPESQPPDPADGSPVAALVARLGSADYAAREAAGKELHALGPAALEPLRAACRSGNPEVARRARLLVARIERRVENEAALAPTLVELKAGRSAVETVLASLSEQTGYAVTLARPAGTPPGPAVTFDADRTLPFWQAVLAVCDAADLQVAAVSGLAAPGSAAARAQSNPPGRPALPRRGGGPRPLPSVQPPRSTTQAVLLEPRGAAPKRPAAVYGAVLIEAFPIPDVAANPDTPAALLQVWPEPKLNWQTTRTVHVGRAADTGGQLLAAAPSPTPEPAPQVVLGNGVVMVRQVGGGVVVVNQQAAVPVPGADAPAFTPNDRQVVVRLRPGDRPSAALAELAGKVYGAVRTAPEPLVQLTGLKPGRPAEGSHPAGVEFKAVLSRVGGRWEARVELSYDPLTVYPGDSGGRRLASGAIGSAIPAVRVTDADGKAYSTSTTSVTQMRMAGGDRPQEILTFTLTPPAGAGPPDAVAFWAGYARPVEVPFGLTGVPLAGGRK
jgi:hypothetical protein